MNGTVMKFPKVVAAPLAVVVAASGLALGAPAASAAPWEPPTPQVFPFVDVSTPRQHSVSPRKAARSQQSKAVWPSAGQGRVDGLRAGAQPVRAGDTPLTVSVPGKAKRPATQVQVEVRSQADSRKLVGSGVVVRVSGEPGTTAKVALDYSAFASGAGGGFGARLRWVQLPGCAAERPDSSQCRTQTPVASTNSTKTQTLAATVTLPQAEASATSAVLTLAAVAGGSSDQGSWTRTSLSSASSWQAGGSAGGFTWSYPLRTPAVAGGLTPSLALSYNSGATDGVVSADNTQSSWVGEGFDLSMGFIERTYGSCAADQAGASSGSATSDLCWFTDSKLTNDAKWDNATISLAGHSGPLVRVGNTSSWRLKNDDGTRVEKIGSPASSSSASSEYWKVTTPDGTQYFFGKGEADGASAPATNARWMVPVAGNQSGEPGYNSAFASAFLSQAWRWNLDYVVDPSGDTMTVHYDKETNRYLENGTTQVNYDRGGTLSSIFYGERQGSEAGEPAAKVTFVTKERCDTTVSSTCETTEPTAGTVGAWPDVPTDAICVAGGYCPDVKSAPTFFTRKRLAQVNTSTRNTTNTGYDPVDTWELTGIFPATDDSTSMPTLWLNKVVHTGQAGTPISLPATTLEPAMMRNRITGPYGTYGLNRPRMSRIWSESGSRTNITYSGEDCTPTTLPSNPATNTTRCFPSYYSPEPGLTPYLTWFTKYVVSKVEVYDPTVETVGLPGSVTGIEMSSTQTTSYTYSGGGAWRWDDSVLTADTHRTWNQWRGYGKTLTVDGTGTTKTVTEDTWFRGMHGDRADSAGTSTTTVNVTDSTGTSLPDNEPLAGQLRETRALTAVGGSADTRTILDPWTQATASASDGRNQATMVDVGKTTSTQYLASGSRTTVTIVKTRDSWGQPTSTEEQGNTAVTGDERCTRTSYATPTGAATEIDLVSEQTVMPSLCSVAASEASMIAGARHYYDGSGTLGQLTGPGFETRSDQLVGSSSHTWRTNQTATYDQHGRVVSLTDALGNTSTAAYSPAANRAPVTVTATSADPDGTGPNPAQVTTTTLDPRFGAAIKTVAPAGQTSEQTLDALGRTTAVWQPGTPSSGPASAKYTYVVNQNSTGINAIKTETLRADGTSYDTSWELLDSQLRARQIQTESVSTGSQVVDVRYDSRSNPTLTDRYLISALPTSSLVAPTTRDSIPNSTRVTYDYANRELVSALYSGEVKKWQTTNAYSGDRVDITPPAGGTPTTTVSDVYGRTTQLIQHLGTTITATASTTSYTYTPAGQLASMTDPKGNKWTYTWDLQGNRLTAADPDAGTATTTYNAVNLPVTVTDARSKGIKYTYDNLGRTTKTTSLNGATTFTTFSYDAIGSTSVPGLLATASRWVNGAEIKTAVNSYDNAGRATSTSLVVPAITNLIPSGLAGTYTTTSSYRLNGASATVGLPATGPVNAETLTYGYNTKGALTSLAGMAAVVNSTAYTQWNTISSISMGAVTGNSIVMLQNRDAATLRLTRIRTSRQVSGTDEDTVYSYDNAGNIIGAKDTLLSGKIDNQCFQYDYQGQLTQAFTAASTTTCSSSTTPAMATTGPAPYWTSWTTDSIGKTSKRVDRSAAGTSTTAYTYPANGGVRPHTITKAVVTGVGAATRNYGFDAAGNTTSRPSPAGATQTLTYNDEGQLSHIDAAGAGVFDAIYDASGARIVKREGGKTTLTVAGTDLVVDNATGVKSASRYYSWQGLTVGVRTGNTNDKLWSIVSDHQGTAHNQVRNSDSQLTTSWQDPYGNPRGTAPSGWTGLRGFVGGTKDGTGLVRVGARDYDPVLNRFTTVDPLQVISDPLQGNAYAYADNSPVTLSDPSGLYIPGDEPGEFFFPTAKKDKHGKTKWRSTKPFQDRSRHEKERQRSTRAGHIQDQLDRLDRGGGQAGQTDPVADFFSGAADAVVDTAMGLVGAGVDAIIDPIGIRRGADLYKVVAANGVGAVLASILDSITQPYTSRWNSGHQAAAIGYGTAEVVIAIIGTKGLTKATKLGAATKTASLESRAAGIHGALDPIAQTRRTTAALGTQEGTTVIGGGVRDLSPAQRALLQDGEMMAGGPGHAEVTTVLGARGAGLTPQEIVTTTNICPACQVFLRNEGATITGPRSARW